jgi:polyhydroxyalkanoate synthesis regulator phasin
MSDDIVTRLRKYLSHIDEYELTPLAYEAADEIERLRKQIRQLEAERNQWQQQAMSHG